MKVKIARAFAYAHNGFTAVQLHEGDEAEVRDELVAGLTAEGYLVDPKGKRAAPLVKPFGDETGPVADPAVAASDAANAKGGKGAPAKVAAPESPAADAPAAPAAPAPDAPAADA